jgi:hypothetical protein
MSQLFKSEERASSIRWVGGWVGPKAGMHIVAKRKSVPTGNLAPIPIIQHVA